MTTKVKSIWLFRRIFIVLMLALSLVGIWLSQRPSQEGREANQTCFTSLPRCEIKLPQGNLLVVMSRLPEIEEQIDVTIITNEQMSIEKAWIEGVNMYMGKIPLPLSLQREGKWSGWFMLGSCSEPNMEWQLNIKMAGEDSPATLRFLTSSD